MDDYNYAFKYTENGRSDEKIGSISDIPLSQYHHYFTVNGRSIVHSLAQLFSSRQNDVFFNFANAFVFVLLITFITFYIIRVTNTKDFTLIWIASFLVCWFLIPAPSTTLMWKTGSLNYLWPSTAVMLFLNIHNYVSEVQLRAIFLPILLLIGIICGWGHEGISIGFALGLFGYHIVLRRSINLQIIFLVIGFWVGTAILLFSPGIWARADDSLIQNDLFLLILKRIMAVFRMFIQLQTKSTAIVLIGLFILIIWHRTIFNDFVKRHLLLVTSFCAFLIFQILTAFPGQARGAMGMEVTAILIILIFVFQDNLVFKRKFFKVIFISLSFAFITEYVFVFNSLIMNYKSVNKLTSLYQRSENGVVRSPFPEKFPNERFIFWLYSFNMDFPQNKAFTDFYDRLRPLSVLHSEIYDGIYTNDDLFIPENYVKNSDGFYTTTKANCYVYRLSLCDTTRFQNPVMKKYDSEDLFPARLRRFTNGFTERINDHYSSVEIPVVLNSPNGEFLLISKLDLSSKIKLSEIKFVK